MAKAKKQDETPQETRAELNDRARYDYGILNAADMQESQLNDEMATIDKQAEDARKEDEKAAKEAAKQTDEN